MPRIGSGGKGDDLNANNRPNRRNAAAATGEQRGHNVDHGTRAIKPWRPGVKVLGVFSPQTARQSHSIISAITSPNNNNAADQTNADTKLAIWNCQYGISKIPAANGTEARKGPKNRPMKMLGTPQDFTNASPRGKISGYRDSGHICATRSLYLKPNQ